MRLLFVLCQELARVLSECLKWASDIKMKAKSYINRLFFHQKHRILSFFHQKWHVFKKVELFLHVL